jgi:hypothetical protein
MMSAATCIRMAVLAGALASAPAAEAAAQVCIGFPTARGQTAAAATVGFPAGGRELGVEAGHHAPAGYSVFGGVTRSRPDAGDGVTSIGGGAAFSVPELRAALPLGLFSCPVVSVAVASGAGPDGGNVVSVPVGLGLGTIVPLGPTMTLSPYAVPQLRWRRARDETSANLLVGGGAILVGFAGPRLYLGGTVNRVFVEEAASIFGLKIGLIF